MTSLAERAELDRLREALDHVARVALGSTSGIDGQQSRRDRWISSRAISALNGDDNWRSAPKPNGYHIWLDQKYPAE